MIHSLLVRGLPACVVALDDPGRRLSMLLGVLAVLILAVDGDRFQGAPSKEPLGSAVRRSPP